MYECDWVWSARRISACAGRRGGDTRGRLRSLPRLAGHLAGVDPEPRCVFREPEEGEDVQLEGHLALAKLFLNPAWGARGGEPLQGDRFPMAAAATLEGGGRGGRSEGGRE